MDVKTWFLAIAFFAVMVFLYIGLYKANKKTPLPKGCEDLKEQCGGCHDTSCANHPQHRF